MTVEKVTATIDGVRNEATDVVVTTKDELQGAETQERAVRELSDRVRELSTDTDLK